MKRDIFLDTFSPDQIDSPSEYRGSARWRRRNVDESRLSLLYELEVCRQSREKTKDQQPKLYWKRAIACKSRLNRLHYHHGRPHTSQTEAPPAWRDVANSCQNVGQATKSDEENRSPGQEFPAHAMLTTTWTTS